MSAQLGLAEVASTVVEPQVPDDPTSPVSGPDFRAVLRDALCIEALLEAADSRGCGDDAEFLLGESIAVLSANVKHVCWESIAGTYPHDVLHSSGQIGALARARYTLLREMQRAPEDEHAFLIDQVGWLDTIAHEVATRLVTGLRAMS